MLTNQQISELMKGGDEFTTELVLTIDNLADQLKNLHARIKKLEENQTIRPSLKVVNDGS
jgi:hypothetical protein